MSHDLTRVSVSIGRKNGILICLAGAFAGYVLTILAVIFGSLLLMVLGHLVTGFTAGSIPIAQAALADLSDDDATMTRNMGNSVAALSVGLVAGPILTGVLSDSALLGSIASLNLPFIAAMALVLVAGFLIVFFFDDKLKERAPLKIGPLDVFRQLWRATQIPVVLRISLVFFFFMLVWNTCFVFIDNLLSSRFGISTLGTSLALLVFGAALIVSSSHLVAIDIRSPFYVAMGSGLLSLMLIAIVWRAPAVRAILRTDQNGS